MVVQISSGDNKKKNSASMPDAGCCMSDKSEELKRQNGNVDSLVIDMKWVVD